MNFRKLLQKHGYADAAFLKAEDCTDLREFRSSFQKYLEDGAHADMQYMENNSEVRFSPGSRVMEGTRTLLITLTPYRNPENSEETENLNRKISERGLSIRLPVYAAGRDYHKTLRSQGNRFAEEITEIYKKLTINDDKVTGLNWRLTIDTAPVPEKYLAWLAGLGFYGKNTLLIHPRFGSFFFISVFFFNFQAEKILLSETETYLHRKPLDNLCGACNHCETNCPGGALHQGTIHASRCTSWAMLEKKKA